MHLLARNEEINQWLKDHPAVLGGGATLLGLVILGFGVKAILSGRSTDKWGREMEGGMARLHGILLAIAGGCMVIFGLCVLLGFYHP